MKCKHIQWTAASLLMAASILMMDSVPMMSVASKTQNVNSVIPASISTKRPIARNKNVPNGTAKEEEDEKEKKEKKPFWPSFGNKSKEEKEAKQEKVKETKPAKSIGPFGIFRRPGDSKKKDDESKEEKTGENESKTNPAEEDKESPKPEPAEDSSASDDSQKDGDEEDAKGQDSKDESKAGGEGEETKSSDDGKAGSPTQNQPQAAQYRVVYRSMPPPSQPIQRGANPGMPSPNQQSQILLVSAFANLITLTSRFAMINWIVSKLQAARELKEPEQHFMWECLNDKYYKDDLVWKSVQVRPPLSMGFSKFKWNKIINRMGPSKEERKKSNADSPSGPSRMVIVIDLAFTGNTDSIIANFSNMVAFLVSANARYKKFFGSEPEVILNVQSLGGEATSFALAAAQVNRLSMAGYKVTACVDRFAASGGYMIASQASQILAAPFAMIGSIGVITESLNFHDALKSYGVKPLTLKAGDKKNPITSFGEVTDKDVKSVLADLEDTHHNFIELCRSKRPELDPDICNGRVLSGDKALESGMVDRILTSEEYIFEKMTDGDLVMKLHLISPESEHSRFLRVLQILPHIRQKIQSALLFFSGGGRMVKFNGLQHAQMQLDTGTINNVVQGIALASMIHRAIQRSGFWKRHE